MRHPYLLPTLLFALGTQPLTAAESTVEKPDAPTTGAKLGEAVGDGVEQALKSIRFGAYGELHYNNFQGADSHNGQGAAGTNRDMIEFHRFVLLGEMQVAKRIRFVTEIELEHGFVQDNQGELELEQCYLDFAYYESHSIRAGVLLTPISIGNLYHEPTVFHGVERSEFDRMVVPTTWFESGASVQGNVISQLGYQIAVQAAPDASKYRAQDGLRAGRQKGYKSSADDLMATARLDYKPGFGLWFAAAGAYLDGNRDEDITNVASPAVLYTLEARWKHLGWDAGVSWGQCFIDNAATHPNTTPTNPVPDSYNGLSAFLAYDVLPLLTDSDQQVYLFVRYEDIDLQADVPSGTTANKAHQSQIYQAGVTWLITPNVVVKADYRDYDNEAETAVDSWNLGVGFAF
jgi:hypothetical protein